MENCSAILFKYTLAIQSSDITLTNLRILESHKERFFEYLEIIQPGEETKQLKRLFEKKLQDFREYKRIQAIMQYLGDFLLKIPEKIGKKIHS